jgi:hypothetical protein
MCSLFVIGSRPPPTSLYPLNGSAVLAAIDTSAVCSSTAQTDVLRPVQAPTPVVASGDTEVSDAFNVRSIMNSSNDAVVLSVQSTNGFSTEVIRRELGLQGRQDDADTHLSVSTLTLTARKEIATLLSGTDASITFHPRHTFGSDRRQLQAQMPRGVASLFANTFGEGVPKRQEVFDDGGVLLLRFLDYVTDSIVARSSSDPANVTAFVSHPLIRTQLAAGGIRSALDPTFLDSVFGVASDEVMGLVSIEIEREERVDVVGSASQRRMLLSSSSSEVDTTEAESTTSPEPAGSTAPASAAANFTSEETWLWYAHLSEDEVQRRLYSYKRLTVNFRVRSRLGATRPFQVGVQPLVALMDDHPRDGCSLREMASQSHIPSEDTTLHTLVATANPFSPQLLTTLQESFETEYFQMLVDEGTFADIFSTTGTSRRLLSSSGLSSASSDASSTSETSESTTTASPTSAASTTTGTTSPPTTSAVMLESTTAAPTSAASTTAVTTSPPTTSAPASTVARELPPTLDALELYRSAYLSVSGRAIRIESPLSAAALLTEDMVSNSLPLGPAVATLRVVNGVVGGFLSPTLSLMVGLFYTCTNARVVGPQSATFGDDSCLSCRGDHSLDLSGLDPVGPLSVLAPFMSTLDGNEEGRYPHMTVGTTDGGFGSHSDEIVNQQRMLRLALVNSEAQRLRSAAALEGVSLPTLRSRLLVTQLVREAATLIPVSGECMPSVPRPEVRYFDPKNLQYVRGGLVLTLVGYFGAAVAWLAIAVLTSFLRAALGFTHNRVLQDVLRSGMGWPSVLFAYPLYFLVQGGVGLSVTTLHYYVLLGTFTDASSQPALYASLRAYVPEGAPSTFFPTHAPISASNPTVSTLVGIWRCNSSLVPASIEYVSNTDNLLLDVGLCFAVLVLTASLLIYVVLTTVVMFPGYHSVDRLVAAMSAGSVRPGAIVFVGKGELDGYSPRLGRWASGVGESRVSLDNDISSPPNNLGTIDMQFLELAGDTHQSKGGGSSWFSARGVWCAVPVSQITFARGGFTDACPHLVARHQLRRMLISNEPSASRTTLGDKYLAKHCQWLQDEPIPQYRRGDVAELLQGETAIDPHHLRSGLFWEGTLLMCLVAAVFAGVLEGLIITTESDGHHSYAAVAFTLLWVLASIGIPGALSRKHGHFKDAMISQLPVVGGGILCLLAALLGFASMPILLAVIYVIGAIYFVVLYAYYIILYVRRLVLWMRWLGLRGQDVAAEDPPPLVSPCSSMGDTDDTYRVFTLQDLLAASDPNGDAGYTEMLPMKPEST